MIEFETENETPQEEKPVEERKPEINMDRVKQLLTILDGKVMDNSMNLSQFEAYKELKEVLGLSPWEGYYTAKVEIFDEGFEEPPHAPGNTVTNLCVKKTLIDDWPGAVDAFMGSQYGPKNTVKEGKVIKRWTIWSTQEDTMDSGDGLTVDVEGFLRDGS